MSEKDTEFIIYTSVRGEILYNDLMPVCSIIKTITPRCRGRPDALLHVGRVQLCIRSSMVPRGYSLTILRRLCGFVAKQKISPNLLIFAPKMFRSF